VSGVSAFGVHPRRNCPTAWRGAALVRIRPPSQFFVASLVRPRRAETSGSRKRPSVMRSLMAFDSFYLRPGVFAARWIFRGSRLFTRRSAVSAIRRNSQGRPGTCQSGSPDAGTPARRHVNSVPRLGYLDSRSAFSPCSRRKFLQSPSLI
jgi:hypothetical protein